MLKILGNTIFLFLIFCYSCYSQQFNNYTLIIGELSGKVAPEDIQQLVNINYYPISRTSNKTPFRIINNYPGEVILEYINAPSHLQRIVFRFFRSEMALAASIITDEIDFARTESANIAAEIHN